MTGFSMGLSGDAVSDPSSLNLYLSYRRLRARDFGRLCTGVSDMYSLAVRAATGHRTLTFIRGDERIRVRPELDIAEAVSGSSIKIKFMEGWKPSVRSEEGELVVGIPRSTGIPLLVAYFLLQAASYSISIANGYKDLRLKDLDIKMRHIELVLKEKELQRVIDSENPALQERSLRVIVPIMENELVNSCQINGTEIKQR